LKKIKLDKKKIEKAPDIIWNKFVDFSFDALDGISQLSDIQKSAVLCLLYHSEMCSGGHSGYFDCRSEINPQELVEAMKIIGSPKCAENFQNAIKNGKADDYQKTDELFYEREAEFIGMVEVYLKDNISEFFKIE